MQTSVKTIFAAAAVIAGATLWAAPGEARAPFGMGRYCAIVNNGNGSVKEICDFDSFEECRLEVVAGNRGTCGNNPVWVAAHGPQWGEQYPAGAPAKRIAKRRHHRRTH